jgi:aspartate-semialdehyde dehydrogenase
MRKRVAVVGATGIAGQQFVVALDRHPWFEVVVLAASERSAGKPYREALRDATTRARRWWCAEEPPAAVLDLVVENADGLDLAGIDLVFTAVASEAARVLSRSTRRRRRSSARRRRSTMRTTCRSSSPA